MIATRRGLIIAVALAVALGVALVLDVCREVAPPSRFVVPGFAAEQVGELAWRASADGPADLRIRREPRARTGWAWLEPPGPADPRAIDGVLSALRAARWHRRGPVSAAGAVGRELVVVAGAAARRIGIGEPLAGSEQHWLVVEDAGERAALLVDAWVARALAPDRLALRVRDPLAAAATAAGITVARPGGELRLEGGPRRLIRPIQLMVAPSISGPLERALVELTVVRVPSRPLAAQRGPAIKLAIELDGGARVVEAGACPDDPDLVAIDGSDGAGCVARAGWQAVVAAVAGLDQPPAQLIERRPLPVEPVRLVLADGTVVDLARQPRVGDGDADPVRIAELLAALAAPGEPVARPAARAPAGRLAITDRAGAAYAIELYGGGVIARAGEPIALRIGDGAYAIATRPASELRDPAVWTEEPTTITEIAIDGATSYARGAVIGEWRRTGPGRDEPATVDRLAQLLAAPRALARRAAAGPRQRVITVTVAPPDRPPERRELVLAPVAGACVAVVGGANLVLADEICRLVDRLLAS